MKQKLKRYRLYIVLLCMWGGLLCGCADRTEQEETFTEMTGRPQVTEPGTSIASGDEKPTDAITDGMDTEGESVNAERDDEENRADIENACEEDTAPTSTPVTPEAELPATVITDPYDGRFWTGKYAEDNYILLTKDQIREQNEKNYRAEGTKLKKLSERTAYTAGTVLGMIEEYSLPSRKYFDNREFGAAEKEVLLQERNLSALRENTAREIIPEYGILISNTDVRSFPTGKRLTSQVQGRFDYLQETRLLIGEAVLVLHRSKDGAWCFVQAENYSGWIRENAIAYCTWDELCDVTEAMTAVESDRIVVVTKNGKYRIGEEDVYLRMGTRLLAGGTDMHEEKHSQAESVRNQVTKYNPENVQNGEYVTVRLPRKDADSRLVWEETSVNCTGEDGEVCFAKGYLAYNRANVMQLAVRLLGAPYAWGDAPSFGAEVAEAGDNGMDCSSTVAAVFRCFGLVLPRNTGTQRKMDCEKLTMSSLGTGQRREALDRLQGGELLYTSGHVMLYLGKVDGEYYVLHNTSTEARDDGGQDEFYRCVITTMGLGKTGQTILERLIQMNALFPID